MHSSSQGHLPDIKLAHVLVVPSDMFHSARAIVIWISLPLDLTAR